MTTSPGSRLPDHLHGDPTWDTFYAATEQVWSGAPNGALVAEVAGLSPGRVLDVGCGEGADAVWLAGQGWDVTGLDPSRVALDRAQRHAEDAGVQVRWVHGGFVQGGLAHPDLTPGSFALVSAQYPVLARTEGAEAERALLAAVAPGGVLLVVHHDQTGAHGADGHGADGHGADGHGADGHGAGGQASDHTELVMPEQVAALLRDPAVRDDWQVEVDERRPRRLETGAGAGHTVDLVLRARRLR